MSEGEGSSSPFRQLIDSICEQDERGRRRISDRAADVIVEKATMQVRGGSFYSGSVFEPVAYSLLREVLTIDDPEQRVQIVAQVMREITDPIKYKA